MFPFDTFNHLWTFWTQNYWRDEVFRVLMAKNSLWQIIALTYNDGQPPLYYFILKIWMFIFGDSEIVTRALSLIFFEILIFSTWYFCRKYKPHDLFFSVSTILLMVVNPLLLYYAFETRMYMLFILEVFFSCILFVNKKYLGWVVFSLLGLYTHNFMILVLIAQVIWAFLNKYNYKIILKSCLYIALFYSPWFVVFLHQTGLIVSDFWIDKPSILTFLSSVSSLYFGYENSPIYLNWLFVWFSALFFAVMILVRKNSFVKFNFVMLFVPYFIILLVSLTIRPLFLTRYLSFSVIPLIFILSSFISSLTKKMSFYVLITSCVLSLIVFSILFPYRLKPDLSNSVIDIIGQLKPGDEIYTTPLNYFETKYYFAKLAPALYTSNIPIKIYTPEGKIPFFVGKVLINDEIVTNKIPIDKRVFQIGENGQVRINSWY